jgi:hypothetical protein
MGYQEDEVMYSIENFKSKKALKDAVKAGKGGGIFAPGMGVPKDNGTEFLEGPHYPAAHSWYAKVEMLDGIIVKVSG